MSVERKVESDRVESFNIQKLTGVTSKLQQPVLSVSKGMRLSIFMTEINMTDNSKETLATYLMKVPLTTSYACAQPWKWYVSHNLSQTTLVLLRTVPSNRPLEFVCPTYSHLSTNRRLNEMRVTTVSNNLEVVPEHLMLFAWPFKLESRYNKYVAA